jgi:hypothetical protein
VAESPSQQGIQAAGGREASRSRFLDRVEGVGLCHHSPWQSEITGFERWAGQWTGGPLSSPLTGTRKPDDGEKTL